MSRVPASGVTLSESDGVRFLHFGTPWVQGAMDLRHRNRLILQYQQQMMLPLAFVERPQRILQLGLGAAALTRFCFRRLRSARVEVVELSPRVIEVARHSFDLPPDGERLQVRCEDAARAMTSPGLPVDVLQVDLYDADARGPVLDTPAFYRRCRAALAPKGVAAINLFGSRLRPSLESISAAFDQAWLRLPPCAAGNVVVLAFGTDPSAADDPQAALVRASRLEARWGFPLVDPLTGARNARAKPWIGA